MLKGRGGSTGFSMVCWKTGTEPRGFHGMPEDMGGSKGFSMACWMAGAE